MPPFDSGDPGADRARILQELETPGGMGGRGFKDIEFGYGPQRFRPQRQPSLSYIRPSSGGRVVNIGGRRMDIGGFNSFDPASARAWEERLHGPVGG